MFVRVYASGTNVQRLAKCSRKIDGVLYTAYSQLEKTEPGMVHRKFFCTHVDSLKQEVEELDVKVQPSWLKIWANPMGNQAFVGKLLQSLVGEDTLRTELNLSNMASERIDCFMLLVSANKKEMKQIKDIAARYIPEWHVKILNGDFTTNNDAEEETIIELEQAKFNGKKGLIVIANQMGSRSYSVAAIQSTVIAYDRGSVDATTQKVSRCLTPASASNKMYDEQESKQYGYIVDLSFDPNRSENIERLVLEEAIQVQRSDNIDFTSAVKFVLSSIDMFKMNEYGCIEEVTETDMFKIFGDNDTMLKVADVAVDVTEAVNTGIFDILSHVTANNKQSKEKKLIVGEHGVDSITKSSNKPHRALTDKEKKDIETVINNAIRSLNMSATSVYDLANSGESYRGCLEVIEAEPAFNNEFKDLFGITASETIELLDRSVLNEAILDVIVQNSKSVDSIFE